MSCGYLLAIGPYKCCQYNWLVANGLCNGRVSPTLCFIGSNRVCLSISLKYSIVTNIVMSHTRGVWVVDQRQRSSGNKRGTPVHQPVLIKIITGLGLGEL